jgi:hypothetical protein
VTEPEYSLTQGMYGVEEDEGDQLLFDFAKTTGYKIYIDGQLMYTNIMVNTVTIKGPVV